LFACGEDAPRIDAVVYGLAGPGLVLEDETGEHFEIPLNGPIALPTSLARGQGYALHIASQPTDPAQLCTLSNASGVVGAPGEPVAIECVTPGVRELAISSGLVSPGESLGVVWASREASSCTLGSTTIDPTAADFGTTAVEVDTDTTFSFTCDVGGQTAQRTAAVVVADTSWVDVSAALTHTCAVKGDGRLFCWGWSVVGAHGADDNRATPSQEPTGATDWMNVSAGGGHTCAMKRDGRVFCWGGGYRGALGTGEPDEGPMPLQEATAATDWAQISAGSGFTCALKTDGRLFCWGWNGYGQIGVPSQGEEDARLSPVQEATGATDWRVVRAGEMHACAIKHDGRLYCWGWNLFGQIGNGTSGDAPTAVTQEASGATDWVEVSPGWNHTCARKQDGRVFCWGEGIHGQLGQGATASSFVPVQEATGALDWASISADGSSTCAVKLDGRAFCWGRGEYGQLGNSVLDDQPTPVQEATRATDWARVDVGANRHGCGLKTDGRIFCWGRGRELTGDGAPTKRTRPTREVTVATDWVDVSVSLTRSCATTSEGRIRCWGWQLANEATDGQPLAVVGPIAPADERSAATDWARVSTGGGHTCAIKTDGRLFCWGLGDDGQLGDGTSTSTLDPVQEATAATDWASVAAGWHHTCAIKSDGRLFCWGDGANGRLGNGAASGSAVPVQDSTEGAWAQVSAGVSHTCAVAVDGRLACWGEGTNGRLGDGSSSERHAPSFIGGADWAQVSAGNEHTCGVKLDGRLFCWGAGGAGALGSDTSADAEAPVQEASGAINWAQVSAGASSTCGLRMDGTLYCWGENNAGGVSSVPLQEADAAATWTAVSTARGPAASHTCGVREGGRVFCWGDDQFGQIGVGAPPSPIWPVD
jgi:alpha-tubulin suppressor-like RCC1 family protein